MPDYGQYRSPSDAAASAENALAVVPDDATLLDHPSRALYVGGEGDLSVEMAGMGDAVVFFSVPAGTILPISVVRVNETGTTATALVSLY